MAFGQAVSGAAGGAGIGSIFGPVGAGVGAGLGFLFGLFESGPDKKREEQLERGMGYLKQARRDTIITGMDRLSRAIAKNKASARRGAGLRAQAMGLGGSAVESLVQPAEAAAEEAGGVAVRNFMDETTQKYNQAELSLQMEGLNAPLEPGVSDYLLPLGQAAATYTLNRDYIKTMEKMVPGGAEPQGGEGSGTASEAPSSTTIGMSRNPVIGTELMTGSGKPGENTFGLGAFTVPEAPKPWKRPRMLGTGRTFAQF